MIAVTADIIGSRALADRASAQRALEAAVTRVETDLPVVERPLRPTVGDEQQGVYPTLEAALGSLLLLRLALPDGIECRYGVGIGPIGAVASRAAATGEIPEGPGWWAAREAIDHVHGLQKRTVPGARTWVVAHESEPDAVHAAARRANAYLLARDQLVSDMTARARRLTYGRCLGRTQRELADSEQITQSAVSQTLAASGSAAVVEGFRLLGVS
ncbi:hypothetical protein LK09_15930 [Microbacterium mangrovi]|uniref:SatD family protein n=1 Tax=Microbacterium mangrovi TaxID=1348253 RepID=A0A0B1ZY31_9MICO|nr:SatD family protein [Microbacterium mangrovi]KHK96135.1 hypothetical protein LK09_15930 [Microbacterium mangrovi]